MSPLRRQSTAVFQSKLTEELNSDSLWTGGTTASPLHDETFHLLEGAATPLEGSPALPTDHLLLSFDDDHFGPPSASPGDAERVDLVEFNMDAYTMSFGNQPDDLYATFSLYHERRLTTLHPSSCSFDQTYQAAFTELFPDENIPCMPIPAITVYELHPQPQCDKSTTAITQSPSVIHSPPTPIDPSTMSAYAPYFDRDCDSPQVPPTPGNASVASPPPPTPSVSSPYCDSSESDSEGDVDYIPPSDDDDEYRPIQATPPQKQKRRSFPSQSKSPRREELSPACSTSSESEKSFSPRRIHRRSHPYKGRNTSRNFQRNDGTRLIDKESDFQCPVVGCDYVQENQRIPDLKRHVVTHDRWMEPGKWTCCGVAMDRAYLYDKGIKEGMTDEECIQAGAYKFGDRLMIGGCMKTFARRDALKRHVDNPNITCVGHMDTYYPS